MYLSGEYKEIEFFLDFMLSKKIEFALFLRAGDVFFFSSDKYPLFSRSNFSIGKDVLIDKRSARDLLENIRIAKDGMDRTIGTHFALLYTGKVLSIRPDCLMFDYEKSYSYAYKVEYEYAERSFIQRIKKYKSQVEDKSKNMNPQIYMKPFNASVFVSRVLTGKREFDLVGDGVPAVREQLRLTETGPSEISLYSEKLDMYVFNVSDSVMIRMENNEVPIYINGHIVAECMKFITILKGESFIITPMHDDKLIIESTNSLSPDELIFRAVYDKKTLTL